MAIEKYIIDKSELSALLRGDDLSIKPKGNIKGFCVEIAGTLTNGDVIKAMFPSIESRLDENTGIILAKWVDGTTKTFKADWWNAPYMKEVEE